MREIPPKHRCSRCKRDLRPKDLYGCKCLKSHLQPASKSGDNVVVTDLEYLYLQERRGGCPVCDRDLRRADRRYIPGRIRAHYPGRGNLDQENRGQPGRGNWVCDYRDQLLGLLFTKRMLKLGGKKANE